MSVEQKKALVYACRVGLIGRTWHFQLTNDKLELSDKTRKIKREIALSEIRTIHLYGAALSRTPENVRHSSEICKLAVRTGRPVYIRSGTYLRPASKIGEVVIDQKDDYDTFLAELKLGVCKINAAATVVSGSLPASLTGWLGVPLGLAFLALAVGGFVMDEFLTAVGIALFSIPAGLFLIVGGYIMGTTYWPKYTTIEKHIGAVSAAQDR